MILLCTNRIRCLLCAATAALALNGPALPAGAVIIETGDGTGNTSAPTSDPGWDYVGVRGGATAIYIGDGCVLTPNHVGMGDVNFGGVLYPFVPNSKVRISNGDGSFADLVVFAIDPFPALPPLPISSVAPPLDDPIVMAGNGRNRGSATSWDSNGRPPPGPIDGFDWSSGKSVRWGTNHVEDYPPDQVFGTWTFMSIFDAGGSNDEAQAATGDSGGASFWLNGSTWELAGMLFAIDEYGGQPADTSFYGQTTYAIDLSFYRDEILDVECLPEPTSGLPAGLVGLLVLGRRRARRRSPGSR